MTSNRSPVFGKRKEPHTVIIARGDQVSHFTVRPWMLAIGGSIFAGLAVSYLFATAYLVFRDDLISANISRQARIQQLYEDRISSLRTQVDRITSRQMLDQQVMENKVAELIERQQTLNARDSRLAPLLERAGKLQPMPPKVEGGEQHTALSSDGDTHEIAFAGIDPIITGPVPAKNDKKSQWNSLGNDLRPSGGISGESTIEKSDKILQTINHALHRIENNQTDKVKNLTDAAYETADNIVETLNSAGLKIDTAGINDANTSMGGPLIPVSPTALVEDDFEVQLQDLDSALDRLDKVRRVVRTIPLANPAPGMPVTSLYGIRRDPIIGTAAFHSGVDFRAHIGQSVVATATGTVTRAGSNGGYGNMVEIDHGNGFSTRYAHLSRISAREGDKVKYGTVIGEAGNTGRSTGPHIHYEVREKGRPLNPVNFIKAGKQIETLL